MAAIRENLTEIEGEIAHREPDPHRPEYDRLVLKVSRAAPVEGKPDLVHTGEGEELPVAVRRELLEHAAPGTRLRLRAARTSSGDVMAEPHPEPGGSQILS